MNARGPVTAVAATARVRDLLRRCPDQDLRELHPGRSSRYLRLQTPTGAWCLGLTGTRAVAVPNALRLATSDLGPLATAPVSLRDGVVHAGDVALRIGRLVGAAVPRLTPTPRLMPGAPPAPDPIDVPGLLGSGDGLTPAGDDLIAGWVAYHRACGLPTPDVDRTIRALAHRTTLFSATLLDCALAGEVLPEYAAYLRSLGTRQEADRTAELARVGHSSGAAMLAGARLAREHLGHHPRTPARPTRSAKGLPAA